MPPKKEGMSWKELTSALNTMDEQTVRAYLNHENSTHKRASYLTRLHQRFCTLRDEREREEILKGALL